MLTNKIVEHNALADQAALKADQAIRATQRVANETLDGLSDSLLEAHQQVAPLLNRASEKANALAQNGLNAVRETSKQLRAKALQVGDTSSTYIRNDPIKSVLIAAAAGAALMGIYSLLTRSSRDH